MPVPVSNFRLNDLLIDLGRSLVQYAGESWPWAPREEADEQAVVERIVAAQRESAHRVAIANANVPNMLGQISSTMAHAGLNIHNMVNKSRGEMAYTLVDVDSPVDDAVIRAVAAIDGVLSVRAIPAEA